MRKYFLNLFSHLILISSCLAQSNNNQTYNLQKDSSNFFTTNFENNINNALLRTNIDFYKNFKNFYINFQGNYSSDISKLSEKYIRDMSNLSFITNYSVSKKLGMGAGIQTRNLSDNRNTELNRNRFDFIFSNFDYQPINSLFINSKLGYKSDVQIGESNQGFSGLLFANLQGLNVNDYISNGKIYLMYENLNPKVNQNYEMNASVFKRFSEKSQNFAEVRAFTNKYEFYIPATQSVINSFGVLNNIQSRTENSINLDDKLDYSFTRFLKASIAGTYKTRNVFLEYKYKTNSGTILFENIYDTKIIENYLLANGKLEFDYKNIFASAVLGHSERSENHNLINNGDLTMTQIREIERIEKSKDNNSQFTTLVVEAGYKISNTNSIRFINNSSILRYDTDSEDNFDDRDEVAFIYAISHRYDNLSNFLLETTFDVNIFKTKYIFKEKSSNNNSNKIYKLTSKSFYAPFPNLITRNQFQVLANYTVYDFEDVISQIQSFSFRQLSIRDSIYYSINKRMNIEFINDLKFYEQGEFRDEEFAVRPLMYYDERKYSSQISYLFYDFLNISFGYRYFIQKQFEYSEGEKSLKRTIKSYGPYAKVNILLNRKTNINIIASRDITSSNLNAFSNNSDNLLIYINWYF